MSNLKEIRRRIGSVSNTKQITRAMKLVSAAKLRRAQDAATGGRDFSKRLDRILAELMSSLPEDFSHPLLEKREVIKKRRLVVVSGDRGLCGPYNTNVQKAVIKELEASEAENVEVDMIAIGRRAVSSVNARGWNLVEGYESLATDPTEWPISEITTRCGNDFESEDCDEVILLYTHFHSAVSQEVTRVSLIPFEGTPVGTEAEDQSKDEEPASLNKTKCDPDAESIVSELINVLISSKLTQAILESRASEHAARMTAMDAATNNASDLIGKLKLTYNRARQSAITTELIDIVGGAEATSG